MAVLPPPAFKFAWAKGVDYPLTWALGERKGAFVGEGERKARDATPVGGLVRATVSSASAFLALPNARCSVAAARPAITKRATPAVLFQSRPAGPAPVILFAQSYESAPNRTKFRLDVGGTLFITTRETLCAASGSVLASAFMRGSSSAVRAGFDDQLWVGVVPGWGPQAVPDAFIDSDPETFAWILGFLRRGCRLAGTPPTRLFEQVRADARSFGLDELVSALDETTRRAILNYDGPRTILNYETKAQPGGLWHDGDQPVGGGLKRRVF